MCGAHAAVRSIVGELIGAEERPLVVDIEAGLEHLSRGTARHVDTILAIVEPYFKSMETAARVVELGKELGIESVHAVGNKIRSDGDRSALEEFCAGRGISLIASIPDDDAVREADRRGVGPLDVDESAPAVVAICDLAVKLGHDSSA